MSPSSKTASSYIKGKALSTWSHILPYTNINIRRSMKNYINSFTKTLGSK